MNIRLEWDNPEQTILRQVFVGKWNWTQLNESLEEIIKHLDAADVPIDIIADLRQSSPMPSGATPHFHRINKLLNHPQFGLSLILGSDMIIRTFAGLLLRVYPRLNHKIRFAATIEEAHSIAQKERSG